MDPILVTGLFDIGREDYVNNSRSVDKYILDFEFWASINNFLIVFTEQKFKQRIENIRNSRGLLHKTKIIVINDIFSIREDLYKKAKLISTNKDFINFRYRKNALSSKAEYNHIMFLKAYFLFESSELIEFKHLTDQFIWIDFGFNHGGSFYTNPNEFNFTISEIKVNQIWIFSLSDLYTNQNLIFQVVRNLKDFITGGIFYVPRDRAKWYWEKIQETYNELINTGLIDDDQLLTLSVFKKYPEFFKVSISNWFEPLQLLADRSLTNNNKYSKYRKKLFSFTYHTKRIKKILKYIFSTLKNNDF
jgi:protein YibB